ncbi:MAG TPA: hypothetical protein VKR21_17075 [Solirubrobacteraceae bacterium]|nr:hypothetical protein [Solirubrobacteraceae bacterium]
MPDMDPEDRSFEETLRSLANELGRFIERSVENADVDQFAESMGIDAGAARDWLDGAGNWLRGNAENLGEEVARRVGGNPHNTSPRTDPLGDLGPHPLDLPTEEQGRALAALESGRWALEPGTDALGARGEGPAPSDALGLVRELRVRDWIASDGQLTVVGRAALSRWLDAAARS